MALFKVSLSFCLLCIQFSKNNSLLKVLFLYTMYSLILLIQRCKVVRCSFFFSFLRKVLSWKVNSLCFTCLFAIFDDDESTKHSGQSLEALFPISKRCKVHMLIVPVTYFRFVPLYPYMFPLAGATPFYKAKNIYTYVCVRVHVLVGEGGGLSSMI